MGYELRGVDRTAVITGAGSLRGIGRATASALAEGGWHVAVLDIDESSAEQRAQEMTRDRGVSALGVGCDVSDAEQVATAVSIVESRLPPVGALVNNAGIASPTRFLDVTDAEWDRILEVNVRGSYLMTKRLAPGMAERGFGRIVNVSSVAAERGGGVFGGVAYSTAKAALLGFSRALARELGPSNVTVNAVAPGLVDTDITAELAPERERAVIDDLPMRRKGTVDDVADVIAFLCRPESSYVTGSTYDINGGLHIH